MFADPFGLLIQAQLWIVVALFALLLWHQVGQAWRDRRELARTEAVAETLDRWSREEASDQELLQTLEDATVHSAWEAFQTGWIDLSDVLRYRLRELVRSGDWFRKVERSARSVFWWRRIDGAQILGHLAKREDSPLLMELLRDRRPLVRLAAVFASRALRFPELREPLLEQAMEASGVRRKAFQEALLSYGDELIPLLHRRLRAADDPRELGVVLELARALSDGGDGADSLVHSIVPHTTHPDLEVRIRAVTALGQCEVSPAVPILHAALRDPAWQVRAQAARSLGRLGAIESRDELRSLLSDPHWWVRLRAGVALRELGRPGEDVLRAVGQSDDPFAHDMSRYVLRLDDRALTTYEA